MDIKQLRYLDALAQEKHFSRAAAACCVSQPTLSLRIRQLEEELGVPLIYRGNRFGGLTPEGERTLVWARRVLFNYEGIYQDIALLKGKLSGQFKLGVIPSALPYVVQLTNPFIDSHKNVSVISESLSADAIIQSIEEFSLDVGISYLDRTLPEGMLSMPLYKESYVVLVPTNRYFVGREQISWAEAATLPLCLLTKNMHNRWIIDDCFEKAGCHVEPQLQSNSILTLYSHVRVGNWATISTSIHIQLLGMPDGVRAIKLEHPDVENTIGLIWRDTQPNSPIVKAFRDVAKQVSKVDSIQAPNLSSL